jgi:uncharacterized protein YeaO (DUF488 family)
MSATRPTAKTARRFRVKRVYEPAAAGDGLRVLVDRLWPRGVAKEKAQIELWLKEVAPSDALRRRVHDGKMSWDEFVAAYGRELAQEPARKAAADLHQLLRRGHVTLLYGSRDPTHNNAVALKACLERTVRARHSPITAADRI